MLSPTDSVGVLIHLLLHTGNLLIRQTPRRKQYTNVYTKMSQLCYHPVVEVQSVFRPKHRNVLLHSTTPSSTLHLGSPDIFQTYIFHWLFLEVLCMLLSEASLLGYLLEESGILLTYLLVPLANVEQGTRGRWWLRLLSVPLKSPKSKV